jgi:hypothetical protein
LISKINLKNLLTGGKSAVDYLYMESPERNRDWKPIAVPPELHAAVKSLAENDHRGLAGEVAWLMECELKRRAEAAKVPIMNAT